MHVKETERTSEEMRVEDIVGPQDPNVGQYLRSPDNPAWVTSLSITDTDGATLAAVRNAPHYGAPCHLVRVEDGRYASILPGAVTGDIFEREVSGENRLCLDLWPDWIFTIDPSSQELTRLKVGMTGKLSLWAARSSIADKVARMIQK